MKPILFFLFSAIAMAQSMSISSVASLNNLKNAAYCADTSVSANTITCTTVVGFTGYTAGQAVDVLMANSATAATTININGLGPKAVTYNGTTPMGSGIMTLGGSYRLTYDGTRFVLMGVVNTVVTTPSYTTTLTGTTVTILAATHGQGTNPFVWCSTSVGLFETCSWSNNGSGDITVTVSPSQTGMNINITSGIGGGGGGGSTTVTGTANQITVSGSVGGPYTLSIPTNPTLPGNTTGTFIGNITGNVTGNVTGTAATITGLLTAPNIAKQDTMDAVSFCSDAGSNDTYACNLSPAITGYVTGTHYRFKANTLNTGAASINFNSLGAKTIVKVAGGITTALATNDILAGQWVDLVYDGTNMQMQSTLGNAPSGGGVTSIATTSPITGGTITTTGTIACATCVTSAAALTSTAIVTGAGSQGSQTPSATATLDGSGNVSTPGSVSTGVGGGVSGSITLSGSTSGSAKITVPAVAGAPADIQLPSATGTNGQVLTTNGATPQVTSWTTVSGAAAGNNISVSGSTVSLNPFDWQHQWGIDEFRNQHGPASNDFAIGDLGWTRTSSGGGLSEGNATNTGMDGSIIMNAGSSDTNWAAIYLGGDFNSGANSYLALDATTWECQYLFQLPDTDATEIFRVGFASFFTFSTSVAEARNIIAVEYNPAVNANFSIVTCGATLNTCTRSATAVAPGTTTKYKARLRSTVAGTIGMSVVAYGSAFGSDLVTSATDLPTTTLTPYWVIARGGADSNLWVDGWACRVDRTTR